MKNLIVNHRSFIKQFCSLCRRAPAMANGLCEGCHGDLPWLIGACPRCAEPLTGTRDTLCAHCQQDPPPFERTLAAFSYEFPLNQLLPGIKYHRRPAALGWLSRTFATWLADRIDPAPQLLIPVPQHPLKELRRGFNQAALIANELSHALRIPCSDTCVRKRRVTTQQAELSRVERQANLRGSFNVRRALPPHVAVVDDVMTTGSTARELSHALRECGATRIDIWVLARTPDAH